MKHKSSKFFVKMGEIILLLVIIVAFLFLPELLFFFRELFGSLSFLKGFYVLNNERYMEIMITPFISIIAVIISLFALKYSRYNLKVAKRKERIKIQRAISDILQIIDESVTAINDFDRPNSTFNLLLDNDKFKNSVELLRDTDVITQHEYEVLIEFFNQIDKINLLNSEKNKTQKTNNQMGQLIFNFKLWFGNKKYNLCNDFGEIISKLYLMKKGKKTIN